MSDTRQLHSLGGGGLLARVLARGHGGNMSAPQGECESAPCLIAGAGGGFGAISMRCSGKGGSLRYVANNGSSWLELSVGSSARAQSSNDLNTSSGPEHPPSIGGAPIGQRWGRAVGSPYSGFRGGAPLPSWQSVDHRTAAAYLAVAEARMADETLASCLETLLAVFILGAT
jgi:hypothetical protein